MADNSGASNIISLPKGGGALHGIGEKFSPDLHTGTGNFTVPIAVPSGRNGFQPQLSLVYSTGTGNGPFGLGWNLSIPGISRQTSKGIPHYNEAAARVALDRHKERRDVFILSGAEDLVPVAGSYPGRVSYRPRTEGLFARIEHVRDAANSYWEVRSKDGLVSSYGTPAALGTDPAVIADPSLRTNVFAWKLTRTVDPFGNRIEYEYERDMAQEGPHHWDQLYLSRIRYVDYEEGGATQFLVTVSFEYDDRPDAFSEYRAGFEIRTRKRCSRIVIRTHADRDYLVRTYAFRYLDQLDAAAQQVALNRASLLTQVSVSGHDAAGISAEELPPLTFAYSKFTPHRRDFFPLTGADLPPQSLGQPEYELADLFGNGLPDVLHMNGVVRYWRNLGNGTFDRPRDMKDAPSGLQLADPGVQLIDADGNGRLDLFVTTGAMSGYFPLRFDGQWDRRSFQRYRQAPSFVLEDPEVKLVDLDGDGVTDAIRSGSRMECFFNDPKEGWNHTRWVERQALEIFPNVNFSDPRVKWADMTGDGLQDIVLVYDGNIEYWPNLGHGNWSKRVHMEHSPRFPYGYDPKRVLLGDVDGDGVADLVYVDDTKVTLWINQSGNGWSEPIVINGTPPVSDMDAVRLTDMLGSGISGLLWSADAGRGPRHNMSFLDFTGGVKPYLLHEMDNHMGAVTKVAYAPSTRFYLEDQKKPEMRWKTPLPFPVQVVAKVEVIDHFSQGKLATEYRYHEGYWDGAEREFRGFGMVEHVDTEVFATYNTPGLHGDSTPFTQIAARHFSAPTLTKTWFHQGPVGDEYGDWSELDWSDQYWPGDPQLLNHTETVNQFLKNWPITADGRRVKRDALRALRGSILRTELYALDGSDREERPYTVTEYRYGLREESKPALEEQDRQHIFFPHQTGHRTTQWERGADPMTQFAFTDDYDAFGQAQRQTHIACPRGWRSLNDKPTEPYLATRTRTVYATPTDPKHYIHNRVAKTTSFEILNTSSRRIDELVALKDTSTDLKLIDQTLSYYDGPAFVGLPFGRIGEFGAVVRTESLVLTDDILTQAYGSERPPYLIPSGNVAWTAEYPSEFRDQLPPFAGYMHHAADPVYAGGYYSTTERRSYDFHAPGVQKRGLLFTTRPPLGQAGERDTNITYDAYGLLPTSVTDPVGLTTQAEYDYRVLQPKRVTDVNGNRTAVTFTPLGLPATTVVQGKAGEGDDEAHPSVVLTYDFLAFQHSPPTQRQPVFVHAVRRVHHQSESDVPLTERDGTIQSREYSDGFGRLLQTRTQAEDVLFGDARFGGKVLPATQTVQPGDIVGRQRAQHDPLNVVVSGWQIYDNKGQLVEKFEPFFDQGWEYAPPEREQFGAKVAMHYDPRGHAIRTVNPDGSEQRVIFGVPGSIVAPVVTRPKDFEPTAWEAYTYDANDLAPVSFSASETLPDGSPKPLTERAPAVHHFTPTNIRIDALGRTVEAVERNHAKPDDPIEDYHTRTIYDIRGNVLSVTDALGRRAFRYAYDLANRRLRLESIDAGIRRTTFDAASTVTEQRDSKGALVLHGYDVLNRPTRLWARDDASSPPTVRERVEYGDGSSRTQGSVEREANRQANRLGKPSKQYDEAGLSTMERYDFKGNVTEKVRRVISDANILAVFTPPPPNWQVTAFRVTWQPPAGTSFENHVASLLDIAEYRTSVRYDALNRVKAMQYPEDVEHQRWELLPHYNHAGALERVTLNGATYVERIAYNAKGQRTLIAYGNGVMTAHAYDPQTFRLTRLWSGRYSKPVGANTSYHPILPTQPLQDLAYVYDLAGNIVQITERTPGCGVQNTPLGKDALDRQFTYDALSRLLSATGRESNNIPHPRPWTDDPRSGFKSGNHGTPNQDNAPNLTRRYTEEYRYDPAGNLLLLRHQENGDTWTRNFGIDSRTPQQWQLEWPTHLNNASEWVNPPSNRLTHVGDNQITFPPTHDYDANGNLRRETTSRHFEWDHSDRMKTFRTQVGNSEPTIHACYLYDAGGQRVKKLVRKQGGQIEATVYIDGMFEYLRIVQGGVTLENNTLHVMDNQNRIALVRVGNPFPDDTTPTVKYHLGDHLASSNVVVDAGGSWVNREEYRPYGETSFGCFARKRYRFTGMERDEESGLNYHGARYYASWLERWTSCDPAGMDDGTNLYPYARNNPTKLTDPNGRQSSTSPQLNLTPPDFRSGEERLKDRVAREALTLNQSTRIGDPFVQYGRFVQSEPPVPQLSPSDRRLLAKAELTDKLFMGESISVNQRDDALELVKFINETFGLDLKVKIDLRSLPQTLADSPNNSDDSKVAGNSSMASSESQNDQQTKRAELTDAIKPGIQLVKDFLDLASPRSGSKSSTPSLLEKVAEKFFGVIEGTTIPPIDPLEEPTTIDSNGPPTPPKNITEIDTLEKGDNVSPDLVGKKRQQEGEFRFQVNIPLGWLLPKSWGF